MSKENTIAISYFILLFVVGLWASQKWFGISMGFEWVLGATGIHFVVRILARKYLK